MKSWKAYGQEFWSRSRSWRSYKTASRCCREQFGEMDKEEYERFKEKVEADKAKICQKHPTAILKTSYKLMVKLSRVEGTTLQP